jgi:hypothetical protein
LPLEANSLLKAISGVKLAAAVLLSVGSSILDLLKRPVRTGFVLRPKIAKWRWVESDLEDGRLHHPREAGPCNHMGVIRPAHGRTKGEDGMNALSEFQVRYALDPEFREDNLVRTQEWRARTFAAHPTYGRERGRKATRVSQEANRRSQAAAVFWGEGWLREELDILVDPTFTVSDEDIAKELGRTIAAVRVKRHYELRERGLDPNAFQQARREARREQRRQQVVALLSSRDRGALNQARD